MDNSEILNIAGKESSFDSKNISGIVKYESGITEFDNFLNSKSLNKNSSTVQIREFSNGLVFVIIKNFSKVKFALNFSNVKYYFFEQNDKNGVLFFELVDSTTIIFNYKSNDFYQISEFLKQINSITVSKEKSHINNVSFSEQETQKMNFNEDQINLIKKARYGLIIFSLFHLLVEVIYFYPYAGAAVSFNYFISISFIKYQVKKNKVSAKNIIKYGMKIGLSVFITRLILGEIFGVFY